jgi:hypothetical protein
LIGRRTRTADGTLIRLPYRRGLQLDDCLLDPKPHELSVVVAAFEHLIGSPGCHDLSLGTMFADQQIGGSPDVAIADHSGHPTQQRLALGDLASACRLGSSSLGGEFRISISIPSILNHPFGPACALTKTRELARADDVIE